MNHHDQVREFIFFPPPGAGEGRVRGIDGNWGLVSEDPPHPGRSPAPGGGKSEKPLATFPHPILNFITSLIRHAPRRWVRRR
jgi:hypothetical protein